MCLCYVYIGNAKASPENYSVLSAFFFTLELSRPLEPGERVRSAYKVEFSQLAYYFVLFRPHVERTAVCNSTLHNRTVLYYSFRYNYKFPCDDIMLFL